jgi:flagellar motor protein MotB
MAAGCKKCDPHEICEECPEWIFTLADLIMCMMGLFVILWVLKPGPKPEDKQKMTEEQIRVFAAIREAFKYEPDPQSQDPIDLQMIINKLAKLKPHLGPGEGGETKIKREGAEGTDPEVTKIRDGKRAGVGGRLLFTPGGAELSTDAKREIEQIAEKIRGHRQIVFVKGHTALDDFKDDATPQRQRDLSIRRAQVVADYLTELKVSPDVLRVQGCSIFEPVVQRAYSDGQRLLNRRVEVEVTDSIVDERQDAARATPRSAPTEGASEPAEHTAEAATDLSPAH